MSIPQHIIEQICDSADLVSIIGRHTTLKKSGTSFKGCCPFHKEKTPSFYVHPDKGYYYCFGCKATGNAISFLMDYEGESFLDSVESLAGQTGISIPKNEPNQNLSYKKTAQTSPPQSVLPPKDTSVSAPISVEHTTDAMTTNNTQAAPTNPLPTEKAGAVPYEQSTSSYERTQSAAFDPYDGYTDSNEYDNSMPYDMGIPSDFDVPTDSIAPIEPEPSASMGSGNLYDLLENICDFYQRKLTTNPKALLYLNQRGLSEQTIQTFRLGYAPEGWQHLETAFPEDLEGLRILGLLRKNDKGREYDLLRDRVIFPIRNRRGRVIGFGGRAMNNDVQPKYINSPESVVFKKQQILYGMHEGLKAKAKDWLIVEGYMDVIALYQAGIYGAVASMGTATNQEQLKKLFGMNAKLTLAFDGDNAGQTAAWRTLELALPILDDEYELKFLLLPEGDDPDSLIKSEGTDAMLTLIQDAPALSDFLYAQLAKQFDLSTPEGKSKLMGAAKKLLDTLPKYGSYKKLLNKDLRERIGLGFKPRYSKANTDLLLDFKSNYSLEQQLVLLLLLSPESVTIMQRLRPQLSTATTDVASASSQTLTNQSMSPASGTTQVTAETSDTPNNDTAQLQATLQKVSLDTVIDIVTRAQSQLARYQKTEKTYFLLGALHHHAHNLATHVFQFSNDMMSVARTNAPQDTSPNEALSEYLSHYIQELTYRHEYSLLKQALSEASSLRQKKDIQNQLNTHPYYQTLKLGESAMQ